MIACKPFSAGFCRMLNLPIVVFACDLKIAVLFMNEMAVFIFTEA